jgi:hypothetical protein
MLRQLDIIESFATFRRYQAKIGTAPKHGCADRRPSTGTSVGLASIVLRSFDEASNRSSDKPNDGG